MKIDGRPILDREVVVCDSCLCACCWQGSFMCDGADRAGTLVQTVRELRDSPHGESPEYWFKDRNGRTDYMLLELYREKFAPKTSEGAK